MKPTAIFFSGAGIPGAVVLALLALLALPSQAFAQSALFTEFKDATGVGIWFGGGTFKIDAAADSATPEVKGYTNIIPASISGIGPGVGVSFSSFGVNIGFSSFEEDLGGVRADVNQTPGNLADDVTVFSMKGTSTTIALLYQPVRWFYAGYGTEKGTIEFSQLSASGVQETRKLSIDYPFYSLGLAVGFDPTKSKIAPILTVFAKFPAKEGAFSGSTMGAGVGLFF